MNYVLASNDKWRFYDTPGGGVIIESRDLVDRRNGREYQDGALRVLDVRNNRRKMFKGELAYSKAVALADNWYHENLRKAAEDVTDTAGGFDIGDFAVGHRVWVLHPWTIGVAHWATITKVGTKRLYVDWHTVNGPAFIYPADVIRREGALT